MSTACFTLRPFLALLTLFRKSHSLIRSDSPISLCRICPSTWTCCVRIFCPGWTRGCQVHVWRLSDFPSWPYPQNTRARFPLYPRQPWHASVCRRPCPGVSPAGCLCSSHFHFVLRIVYEAQSSSLMQVDVLGTQTRHPCISRKVGLRAWCSLAKPAGTLIPAVQLH